MRKYYQKAKSKKSIFKYINNTNTEQLSGILFLYLIFL